MADEFWGLGWRLEIEDENDDEDENDLWGIGESVKSRGS
jgi:hypothetical protein